VIEYFVPEGFVHRHLSQRGKTSLLYAVGAGFFLSACSHGILAIAIQLYKKGANIASVVTFLLASPWANLPVTVLLFSFFGWKALVLVMSAIIIALVTGWVFMGLESRGWIEKSKEVESTERVEWTRLRSFKLGPGIRGVAKGSLDLANMVLWWIMIGFMAAVLIRAYVPHEVFMRFFGPSFGGLLMTLGLATVIEVCSEGSAPIAFEVFNRVGKLGNPFVFLMAGVVTDYTEIGLIWSNIGRKTAIWLPVVTVPQVLLLGYLFNLWL
jgi:uncharacterized membrane protein YraQ (UPF0718 family)